MTYNLAGKRIFVAGRRGMVGSAVVRRLAHEDCIVLAPTRKELDLTDQSAVHAWFGVHQPHAVIMAAAKVGGIGANMHYPADFILQNLLIQNHTIHAALLHGVEKLLFLGSSCIYPRLAPQPMKESDLFTGPLEPTNEPYAIAKLSGLKLCEAIGRQHDRTFFTALPCNLYGPGDNYDLENSHVMAAMIRKFHEAKVSGAPTVTLWGTGTPQREFMFVDDLADALIFLLQTYEEKSPVNVGSGEDLAIRDLAQKVSEIVGFNGTVTWDRTKPDGTPRKLLDITRLHAMPWRPKTGLEEGIGLAYNAFLNQGG